MKQKKHSPEFDYFIHNALPQYEGQYVAIIGRKVVSHGTSAKEVWEKARKTYAHTLPTIAKIPKKEMLIPALTLRSSLVL